MQKGWGHSYQGSYSRRLCHAHIHLDKCFLLNNDGSHNCCRDFAEALKSLQRPKPFPSDLTDLYNRGKRLVIESIQCGVTAMRAHVEWTRRRCTEGVQAVGSAPYVEPSIAQAKRNIDLILDTAHENKLHADFHLDYNLDPTAEPLIWYLLAQLRSRINSGRWADGAHVCVGHATRLSLFSAEEWTRFRMAVEDAENQNSLPITLPGPPRATLDVPGLAREHRVKVGMAVNNVENAFTPQGTIDPLALCPMGVAVFQDGTKRGCQTLVEAVTITARKAIAARGPASLFPAKGDAADFVLLHENDSLYSAALNPSYTRTVIKDGEIVATRRADKWIRLVAQQ
ncbi:uncharacterized protein B0H18DRAFT_1081958 [Fomitopsis serialis]|uniref:uncharacterized protein n=1 Tax=Fomitopsis serialis TaxID=139415 RepID=UPI0020085895|nr:uncharacterized protein B0H18DRAFT_1081958 [Neoantrodia serialis]KAH9936317.1 hypothetical protein B0H18DRAFT_1081958 [Neoantrodia serialis]